MVSHSTPPYTIGFFTTGSDLEYSSLLAHTVSKVAKEKHITVINFLGGSLNPNFSFTQYKYQYQCNVAFNYGHSPHIDGIILASGILASFLDNDEFTEFYSQYLPLPLVSLGVDVPGLPSVYANHTEIFTELVSHLISVHHKKRIAFISGPSSNTDSFERYVGYVHALCKHNLPLLPELVYIGDFTPPSAKDAIYDWFDIKHADIDAIVCANDAMALTVISELKNRGYSIPQDIMVTGCDNLPSTAYCVPSLTSISQSLETACSEALQMLVDKIEGKDVHNTIIPNKIFYRESCPYLPLEESLLHTSLEKELTNNAIQVTTSHLLTLSAAIVDPVSLKKLSSFLTLCREIAMGNADSSMTPAELAHLILEPLKSRSIPFNKILQIKDYLFQFQHQLMASTDNIDTLHYLQNTLDIVYQFIISCILDRYDAETLHMKQNFSFIRQFLLTITHNISDRTKQLQSIIPALMDFGIHSFLIYLYPNGIVHNLSDTWKMPEEINLYMGFVDGKIISPATLPKKVAGEDVAVYGLNDRGKNYVAYVHPIFFSNEQLGICVFELEKENYTLIESITVELACALKLSSTFNIQRQAESKLEALSQTDELTGLLNRRGFFNLAQDKFAFSMAKHHNGILFYADMDGLKTINDTYGHHEGDYAITSMADILKQTFSDNTVLGRIGGDEFVILCTHKEADYIQSANEKILALCNEFNAHSNKPYVLSISAGGIFYEADQCENLESLLSKADKLLYEEKKLKKAARAKLQQQTS